MVFSEITPNLGMLAREVSLHGNISLLIGGIKGGEPTHNLFKP